MDAYSVRCFSHVSCCHTGRAHVATQRGGRELHIFLYKVASLRCLFSFFVCCFRFDSSTLHWSLHRSFVDPSSIPSSTLHRPFIDPSSTLHWSLHRSFIDPFQHVLNYFRTCWLHEGGGEHCNQTSRIIPKMSSTNRFRSTAAKLPDRRSFPQLRTDVDTQGEKHHWSLHRSFIDPSLIPWSILHRPFISPRPPFIDPSSTLHQPKTTPRPTQDHPKTKTRPPIEKVSIFSSKILIFQWKNVGLGPKRAFRITF